jgi:hypothetical protein
MDHIHLHLALGTATPAVLVSKITLPRVLASLLQLFKSSGKLDENFSATCPATLIRSL